MMHSSLGCIAVFISAVLTATSGDVVTGCDIWKNITRLMSIKDGLDISCDINPLCTGFECSGRYTYMGLFSENINFGMEILPCDSPLKLRFSLNIRDYPFTKDIELKSEPQHFNLSIPGANRIFGTNRTEGYVIMSLELSSLNGAKQILKMAMNFTMKIARSSRDSTQLINIVLVPPVSIPIPPCANSHLVPTDVPASKPDKLTYPPAVMTGKSCIPGVMYSCKSNQICTPDVNNKNIGVCSCFYNYELNSEKECVPVEHPLGPQKELSDINNNIWVIVGSVVAGVVVIGAILTMIIFKYRRYQQRYGQHELLVTDATDATELDNPDPPMLEA